METNINKLTEAAADRLMDDGFHCSQCVFPYAAHRLGMDKSEAFRLSAGLGGGCFHGDSCGAVTGAIMALGLVYGFDRPNAGAEDALLISQVREFERRFLETHGSLLCRNLLDGFDKAEPAVEAPEGTYANCPAYCATACRILDEMLCDYYCQ